MAKAVNSNVFECKYRVRQRVAQLVAKPLVIVFDDGSTDVLCPALEESKSVCRADTTPCVYKKLR